MYALLPLSPRKLGTSLRVRGKLILRRKVIKFYYFVYAFPDILAYILFLVLFSFKFYPLHKNDGRDKIYFAGDLVSSFDKKEECRLIDVSKCAA